MPLTRNRIRHQVWERMEREGLCLWPRPCYFRVPHFAGAADAARRLAALPEFERAACTLCLSDHALEEARRQVLLSGRRLALLRAGMVWEVAPGDAPAHDTLSWIGRIPEVGRPLQSPVGLVVVGSVAVDERGVRLGLRGSPDDALLLALRGTRLLPEEIPVATLVHEAQVLPKIPARGGAELRVDLIVTPERTIRAEDPLTKPLRSAPVL